MHSLSEVSEDAGEMSDMNLSEEGQWTAAKALRKGTHAFSAEEAAGLRDVGVSSQTGDPRREDHDEESRYVMRPSDTGTQRSVNSSKLLENREVQFVTSDSADEGKSLEDGVSQDAHVSKRRRIEPDVRTGQARQKSKRIYWASKRQVE